MLHALEGIFIDKLPYLFLAPDDRGAIESQLFWQSFFDTLFKFPYTSGWTFKYHVATGNTVLTFAKPSFSKTPRNLSFRILGFSGAIPRKRATYLVIVCFRICLLTFESSCR